MQGLSKALGFLYFAVILIDLSFKDTDRDINSSTVQPLVQEMCYVQVTSGRSPAINFLLTIALTYDHAFKRKHFAAASFQ